MRREARSDPDADYNNRVGNEGLNVPAECGFFGRGMRIGSRMRGVVALVFT